MPSGRIAVLGAGVMGSAMSLPATSAGLTVDLVGTHLDEDIVQDVGAGRPHPGLKVVLPEGVKTHSWADFSAAVRDDTDLIILGVSSAGVDWAIERLCEALTRPIPILMVTKGMHPDGTSLRPFPNYVSQALNERRGIDTPVMAIGGPCIAGELAVSRETGVVFAGNDPAEVERTIERLRAPYYHARPSSDVTGMEVCAAFKNFYAIGVGAAAGLLETSQAAENSAKMHNPAASLFAQATAELATLSEGLGGQRATAYGMAGVGDLHVTCQAGRNSRMGRLLGLGLTYRQAKAEHMAADTVEGAELALYAGETLRRLMAEGTLPVDQLPLTNAILTAVCDDRPLSLPWHAFHHGTS